MTSTLYAQADPTGATGYSKSAEANNTYSVAFEVVTPGTLREIWVYSPAPAAGLLPEEVGLFEADNLTALMTAPASWSGAAGTGWISTPVPDTALATGKTYFAVVAMTTVGGSFNQAYLYGGTSWIPATSVDGNITTPLDPLSGLTNGPTGHIHPYQNDTGASVGYPATPGPGPINWLIDVGVDFGSTTPLIDTTKCPGAIVGESYKMTVVASGGATPYSWSVSSGSLPAGLSLDSATGVISGIASAGGVSDFAITVTDANANTAAKNLSIVVSAAVFTPSDNFHRPNGGLGANWTNWSWSGGAGTTESPVIQANEVLSGGDSSGSGAYWSAATFHDDQYAEVTVAVLPGPADFVGVTVRQSGNGSNGYSGMYDGSGAFYIFNQNATPSPPALVSGGGTMAAGDKLKIAVIGTTITLYKNGVSVLTATDATHTSGHPGISFYGVTARISSWFGGGGSGNGTDLAVAFLSTSSGVDTYTTTCSLNNTGSAGPQNMKVLSPTSPASDRPHGFLWMLPVEPSQGTTFGDGIATAQSLGIPDTYNLTCIMPAFPIDPWYGDSDSDPLTQQESFMLTLIRWAKINLGTTGFEKHYLIGFSKSGFGSQVLFLRNQNIFEAAAGWDNAADYQTLSQYDGGPVFGTQANLDNYELYDPNLAAWAGSSDLTTVNRIWVGAGINLVQASQDYSDRLTADGILHTYSYVAADSHNWSPNPGWVGPAVAAMLGAVPIPNALLSSVFI